MPVTRLGPRCETCPQGRPVWQDGQCAQCWHLSRAFGPPLTRESALLDMGAVSEAPEFDRELHEWLDA